MKEEIDQLRLVNLLLLAFSGGIFLADQFPGLNGAGEIGSGIVVLVIIVMLYKRQRLVGYGVVLLFLCVGFSRATQVAVVAPNDVSVWLNKQVTVTGMISGEAQVTELAAGLVRVKYVVDAQRIGEKTAAHIASGRLQIYVQQKVGAPVGEYGDKLTAKGEMKVIHGYRNPGQIDTAAMALRQGIGARLHTGKQGAVLEKDENWHWQKWVNQVRQRLLTALRQVMPQEDAAAIFAMLFGGYGGIRPELLEAFTVTGIVHILSVSGSHIALLAGTLRQLGKFFKVNAVYLAISVITAIIIYAGFAGFTPPVLRSAAMGILAFTALVLGREKDARRLLALIALIMLAVEPRLLYDISFQLSFGATAGLLYLAEPLRRNIRLPEPLAGSFAVTIAAQTGVLPILAWYFNSLSLSSLLANFFVVPIIDLLLMIGLFSAIIGLILPLLQNILFVFCSLLLGFVYNITSMMAALPLSHIYLPSGNLLAGGFYYVSLYLVVCPTAAERLNRKYVLTAMVSCCAVCTLVSYWGANQLRVHFIDVGQGDAALIITPHNHAVLVDTGGVLRSRSNFDVGDRVVVPYLRHYGVAALDYLVLTHAHDDHAGGAAAVCKKINVKHILIGREDRQLYARALRTSVDRLTNCIPAYAGQSWTVDGVIFRVLHAAEPLNDRSGNETSSVIKLSYGRQSFLLTGDLDAAGEAALLTSGADIGSTVLKVAHHGSKTSSTPDFLQGVHPAVAVISVGADNQFGHPAKAVLERLGNVSAKVLRTDRQGAIVCQTDGNDLTITTFLEDR